MKGQIRKSVAQQIVKAVKDVSGHDVNFIDKNGVIFASTDPGRVGAFHRYTEGGEHPLSLSGRADRRHRHQWSAGQGPKIRLSGPEALKIGIGSSDLLTCQDRSYQAAHIALASLTAGQNLAAFDQLNLEILLGTISADANTTEILGVRSNGILEGEKQFDDI